jgi:hypothetical protein
VIETAAFDPQVLTFVSPHQVQRLIQKDDEVLIDINSLLSLYENGLSVKMILGVASAPGFPWTPDWGVAGSS